MKVYVVTETDDPACGDGHLVGVFATYELAKDAALNIKEDAVIAHSNVDGIPDYVVKPWHGDFSDINIIGFELIESD